MSNIANQTTTLTKSVHNHGLKSVDSITVDDQDYKRSFIRRKRIQGAVHKHIDKFEKITRRVKGVEQEREPLISFRGCGFATQGFNSVKVKIYGNKSRVVNLSHCNNPLCPYCYLESGLDQARKAELALNGAFAHGYSVWFVTFTKERILDIERSISTTQDWMTHFRDWFKNTTRNKGIKGACYINTEFTISKTWFKDPDWEDGRKSIFPIHAHNHAIIALANDESEHWNWMKKNIEESYVKFLKGRGIKTFKKGNTTRDGRKMESIHWDQVTHPNKGLASYLSKVERPLKTSAEIALSAAKEGKNKVETWGLFQALDYMETCGWKDRQALELTIARVMIAMSKRRNNSHYNFIYQRGRIKEHNLGKLGYELKTSGCVSKINGNTIQRHPEHLRTNTLNEMMSEYSDLDWSHLVNLVAKAMAMPIKGHQDTELDWIISGIRGVQRFDVDIKNAVKIQTVLLQWKHGQENEKDWQKVTDAVINSLSTMRHPDRPSIRMMLNPLYIQFLLKLGQYDRLVEAIRLLVLYEVDNLDGTWKELTQDEVEPIGTFDVHSKLWNRLHGQGKSWNLIERCRSQAIAGIYPDLQSRLDGVVVPHPIDDYVIVEDEFDKLIQDFDL